MKHIKLFENFENDFNTSKVVQYEEQVAERIIQLMEEQIGELSNNVTGDDKIGYILDMIDGHENIHREWVANYPEHVQMTVGEYFENGASVEEAANELVDACIILYNGHGSSM